ncbi:MAG: hypothetical protein JO029_15065, partial [Candidatus Eremiobacteraeota bacterium]|nr:hypothetical protein [Candidatus Eremiobacteraeota bacterium]
FFALPSANSDPTGSYPSYGTPGLASAGIAPSRVYTYVDDSHIYSGDAQYNNIAPGGADASAEARDCSGNPITINNHGGYLSDPYQPATVQLYNNDVTTQYNYSSEYGIVFIDDIDAWQYNDNGALPCHSGAVWSQPSVSSAYESVVGSIAVSHLAGGHAPPMYLLNALAPVINEAGGSGATVVAEISSLAGLGSVLGMDCENCYADNSNPEVGNNTSGELPNKWTLAEDAEIASVNARKIFWLQDIESHSTGAASYAGRIYGFASFMLTWDPVYTVYQNLYYGDRSDGEHPNSSNPQIHVFPEEALTAYVPLVPYPSNASLIAALKDSGGTYFREYQYCYYTGNAVGTCAFVVNPDSSAHNAPTLRGKYTHTLTISSQLDVLDGGSVSLTGAAMPSSVGALTAYVLLP